MNYILVGHKYNELQYLHLENIKIARLVTFHRIYRSGSNIIIRREN